MLMSTSWPVLKPLDETAHMALPSRVKSRGMVVRASSWSISRIGRHSDSSSSRTITTMPPSSVGASPPRTLNWLSARKPMKPGFSTILVSSPVGRCRR